MSAKPTLELSRWATGGVNITVPTSGERDTGFVPGTPASSKRVNSLLNQYFLWAQYLNDGVFSGAASFDNSLTITGLATFNDQVVLTGGDLTLNGGALTVGATSTLTGDVTTGGNVTIGGRLLVFTDFTFTADSTTDQLTKTAHGLQTGDGPVRTSNSGGALPGGLTAGTDYWVIKIDANSFKLAISSDANAFAGIAIDITSNGTGTQTLNHQPTTKRSSDATVTRNLTVGGSVTVGANQHVTVSGTGDFKHGNITIVIPASDGISPNIAGSFWSFNSTDDRWLASAINDHLVFPIRLVAGRRIRSIDVWFQRNGGTLTFDLRKSVLSTAVNTSIASTTVNSGTSITSVTLAAIDHTILSTNQYLFKITAGAANDVVHAVVVTYDNP